MKVKNKKYFTTGEFAKLANVSKQTLIFYDKIGVFSPEYKNENNFRYYSLNQFDTLDTLISLREIGLSLDHIKEYLNNRSPEKALALLYKENESINKQIKNLQIINRKIENKIAFIKEGVRERHNLNPYIMECEEEFLIISDVESHDPKVIMMSIIKFINYCKEKQFLNAGYPICAMVKKEDLNKNHFNNLSTIYFKVHNKINDEKLFVKPKGIYACINHKGSYETTYKSYKKLLEFIKSNHYEVVGNAYENGVLECFSCSAEDEFLTQIAIEVRKK